MYTIIIGFVSIIYFSFHRYRSILHATTVIYVTIFICILICIFFSCHYIFFVCGEIIGTCQCSSICRIL